jgi:ribosomal protein S27AE
MIEIAVNSDAILLIKVEDRCVFCGATTGLSEFSKKLVCGDCVSRLAAENPSLG